MSETPPPPESVERPEAASAEARLSLEEAMAALSLSRAEVYRMVGEGKLKGEKVDHRLRFAAGEVERAAGELRTAQEGLLADLSAALERFAPLSEEPDSGTDAAVEVARLGKRILREAMRDGVDDIAVDPVVDGDRLLLRRGGRRHERDRWPTRLSVKMKEWFRSQAAPTPRGGVAAGTGRLDLDGEQRQLTLTAVPTRMGEHLHLRLHAEPPAQDLVTIGYEETQATTLASWFGAGAGLLLLADAADGWSQRHRMRLAQRLAAAGRLVVSVEHRLHKRSPDLVQLDVDSAGEGVTFADLWRSVLAMDPDVIVIDEVQDADEARLAVAGAGGALVLAQVMAGSAPAALRTLTGWGIAADGLTAQLLGAVERRSARRLCPSCRQPGRSADEPFRAAGCGACDGGDAGHRAVVGLVPGADLTAWLGDDSVDVSGGDLGLTAAIGRAVVAGEVRPAGA